MSKRRNGKKSRDYWSEGEAGKVDIEVILD